MRLVTYPDVPGAYVPLIFVPGLNGIVYAEFYTDVLNYVTSHGYVLLSFDLGWPGVISVARPEEEPELLFEALHWVNSASKRIGYGWAGQLFYSVLIMLLAPGQPEPGGPTRAQRGKRHRRLDFAGRLLAFLRGG